jgi:hypothetical protein
MMSYNGRVQDLPRSLNDGTEAILKLKPFTSFSPAGTRSAGGGRRIKCLTLKRTLSPSGYAGSPLDILEALLLGQLIVRQWIRSELLAEFHSSDGECPSSRD